jgi:hypothetical protein
VDVQQRPWLPHRAAGAHSYVGGAHGDRESDLRLHPHPRCLDERWPSCGKVDDCAHPEGGRHPSEPTAPDDVAHVPPRALAALVATDFFTTEVWTARGLVTYCTAFVIELHSRRVRVLGLTPYPDGAFVVQAVRGLLGETDTILREDRILLCDRDPNWTASMEAVLSTVGVRVVRTSPASPNCNAHAERFVRSVEEECLDRQCVDRPPASAAGSGADPTSSASRRNSQRLLSRRVGSLGHYATGGASCHCVQDGY